MNHLGSFAYSSLNGETALGESVTCRVVNFFLVCSGHQSDLKTKEKLCDTICPRYFLFDSQSTPKPTSPHLTRTWNKTHMKRLYLNESFTLNYLSIILFVSFALAFYTPLSQLLRLLSRCQLGFPVLQGDFSQLLDKKTTYFSEKKVDFDSKSITV